MGKKVYLIHGWASGPDDSWLPWLEGELENRGFEVIVPKMPEPMWPKIESWVDCLQKTVGSAGQDCFFVGHSVGCQAILRYLETLPEGVNIGGIVCVGGWFSLRNLEADDRGIAQPWLETGINYDKIKLQTNKITAIFSDNDPWVPIENTKLFEDRLDAKIIIVKNKGHFDRANNIYELPVGLNEVLVLAGRK